METRPAFYTYPTATSLFMSLLLWFQNVCMKRTVYGALVQMLLLGVTVLSITSIHSDTFNKLNMHHLLLFAIFYVTFYYQICVLGCAGVSSLSIRSQHIWMQTFIHSGVSTGSYLGWKCVLLSVISFTNNIKQQISWCKPQVVCGVNAKQYHSCDYYSLNNIYSRHLKCFSV